MDYFKKDFLPDLKAGFITSIVALPLAIAFAVASGVSPVTGLYTAVIAGILGSIFGGSIFSITGPTGAMSILVLTTVSRYGPEGLMLTGLLAGLLQLSFGILGLGRFVKYIPLPVISGFTGGVGLLIFLGQVPNLLGLTVGAHEHVVDTVIEALAGISGTDLLSVAVGLSTYLALRFLPGILERFRIGVPASLIPLVAFTALAFFLPMPVVGEIPTGFPALRLPVFTLQLLKDVFPSALTIALLGSIEALLCAVVCDAMTSTKHSSDRELLSQGIANVVVPFFGGIPATAAIARSAVNIREGARTRFAGVIHALFILSFILVLGPAVSFVPKAFLAGMLMFVSLRMINVGEIRTIMRISKAETFVLVITFLLTVVTDLVVAVQTGMILAVSLFFIRFVSMFSISSMEDYDQDKGLNAVINADPWLKSNVSVYTIHGPFFFGAMSVFEKKVSEHMSVTRPIIILMMYNTPFIDASGVTRLKDFIKERRKKKGHVFMVGLTPKAKEKLFSDEEFYELMGKDKVFKTSKDAIEHIKKEIRASRP